MIDTNCVSTSLVNFVLRGFEDTNIIANPFSIEVMPLQVFEGVLVIACVEKYWQAFLHVSTNITKSCVQ